MLRKNKNLEFNINSKNSDYGSIESNFYTGDNGSATISIRIKYGKDYLNLTKTGMKPKLNLYHSNGSVWLDEDLFIPIPEIGLIQYDISSNVIRNDGTVSAKLFLENGNKSIHVANFSFVIKDSGIEGIEEKDITVELVRSTLIEIMKENSLGILDDGYKESLFEDIKGYLLSNESFRGQDGEDGLQGPQGLKGDKGDTGAKGDKGDTGEQGPQGLQGIRGPQGLKGDKGDKGNKGDTGLDGQDGAQGIQGPRGYQGIQGIKGDKGDALKYAELSQTEKEDLKSNITDQAVTDFVLVDGVVTDKKIADKAIINTKLADNFATVRILDDGEDLKLVNREGNYFKNTERTLLDLPTQFGNGAGKSFIITVSGYSQWHYVQTLYDLNNDATTYVRTVKNQVSSAWHAQSDDPKIVGMANDQANIKMQYNLNVFEKYNNEVVPDKTMKYYTAIQDIKITGIDKDKPVKIWTLCRNFSTWGYRIIIGQKIDGVWKSIIDTANGGLSVIESTNGITEIEYTRNGITLKARIDYKVIQDNDRLLDHSAMTDEPYFIIRPSNIGVTSSSGGGGTAYNQSLNTTDNVRFASIKADSIEVGGELKTGTLQNPPTGLVKGDMWLDTTDSTEHPILRVMS